MMRKLSFLIAGLFVFIAASASPAQDGTQKKAKRQEITLQVDGLSCPFCAYGLEKKLKSVKGVKKTDIKLNNGMVKLYVDPQVHIDSLTLKKKIDEAGFTLKRFEKSGAVRIKAKRKR